MTERTCAGCAKSIDHNHYVFHEGRIWHLACWDRKRWERQRRPARA